MSQRGLFNKTHLLSLHATPTNGLDLSAHRSKKEDHPLYVCAIVMVPFLSRMPLQLYDLPSDMIEMIGKSYDEPAQRDATATLQATLNRHLLTRCEDPRHTSRTNTPGEAPVLCYQYCHKHPRGVNAGRHGEDVAAARHDGPDAASDDGPGPADAVWHVSNPRAGSLLHQRQRDDAALLRLGTMPELAVEPASRGTENRTVVFAVNKEVCPAFAAMWCAEGLCIAVACDSCDGQSRKTRAVFVA